MCIHVRQVSFSSRYASYSAILVPFNLVFYFLSDSPLCVLLPPFAYSCTSRRAYTARTYTRTRCSRHGAWVSTMYGGYIFHERRYGNDSATLNSDVYRLKGRFHRDTDRQVQYRLFPCERTRSRIAVGAITERCLSLPPQLPPREPSRVHGGASLRGTHTHTHTHRVCSYNINT